MNIFLIARLGVDRRLQRLRFQLQLSSVNSEQRQRPVQQIQNQLRSLVSQLRRLEKDTFLLQRAVVEEPHQIHLLDEIDALERQV